jgi:hypothetical protein
LISRTGEIDELWAKEAEDRIDAYDSGKMKAISLERFFKNTGNY